MKATERRLHQEPDCHHNPTLIEWSLPHEGIEIRLHIDHPNMEGLPPGAREKMTLTVGRFAQLCEYVVARQNHLQLRGMTAESAFSFLAENMKDLHSFYQMMTGELESTESEEFPS